MATGVPLRVPRWTDAAAPLPRNFASEGSNSSTDVAASSVYLNQPQPSGVELATLVKAYSECETDLHRHNGFTLLFRGLDRGSFGRVFGGLVHELIQLAAHARADGPGSTHACTLSP